MQETSYEEWKASTKRLPKFMKERIVFAVANGWLKSASELIEQGRCPAKLSPHVRQYVADEISAHITAQNDGAEYYVPSGTITKLVNASMRKARELIELPRYAAVKKHFSVPRE